MPRPYNTPTDDMYSTSPGRDKLLCELLEVMDNCADEQLGGCDNCRVHERCARWLDSRVDVTHGKFSPEKLARCKAEFEEIRAGK